MARDIPSNITTGKYVRQIVVTSPGPQGPQGSSGLSGVQNSEIIDLVSYTHNQSAVSSSWTINHNLNFYPNVTVYDSAGTMVEAAVTHVNPASLTIVFSDPISGKAHLS
jgi:hypothetical protein